jgi:hypothetical protein
MARAAGVSLARSLAAGSLPPSADAEQKAKGKGTVVGGREYGYDLGTMIVWRTAGETKKESHGTFTFFLSLVWFCHGRSLEAWKEGKEDAMWDGGRHESLVRWRLDLSEAFLFCAGDGVGEGMVCFGIVVVMNGRKVPYVNRTR